MNFSLRQFFLVFTMLAICFQLNAATVTWDGGAATNNWTDATNWSTDALPTMSDDVDLNGATVVLTASTQVQRVYAGGSSNLTINSGVTLTISGFTGSDDGLEVQTSATVTNNGTIAISNINTTNTDADGLYSKGTFVNNGTITIDGVGQHGIYLQGGTFTNNAGKSITVTNYGQGDTSADGMYVDDNGGAASTLNNNGSITITMTAADDGIYINDGSIINNNSMITVGGASGDNGIRIDDAGVFNNNSGGTFTINATPDDQLFLDNACSFNNTGTVNLNNASDVGLYVTDDGVFTNNVGGTVNVSSSSNYGIQIDANSKTANIVNNGTINITGGSNDGVRLQEMGVFNNNAGGTLTITNAGDEGIQIDDNTPNSIFNNSGTVSILNSTDHGMENFGTFNNSMGGTYQALNSTDDGIKMRNTGVFNNDGAINISGSGSEDIETDGTTFTNTANATFAPGDTVGIMEIKDDFDLGASTTAFDINGTTAGTDFDQIQNFNDANIITLTNAKAHLDWGSYVPSVGDKFKVIDGSGDVVGTFSSVTSSNANIQTTLNYSLEEVEVEVTAITPDSVDITFLVNTANITVDPTGLYVGGGTGFGGPSDNLMADANGDGVWEITLRRPKGFSSDYIFLNGNSGWGAKEVLAGLPCSVAPWDDRHLPGVWSDTTLLTCYGTCATDTVCATPLAKPSLPITFQDTVTINHAIAPFGGNSSHLVVDPTNAANTVLQSIKTTGAQTWAGTSIGGTGLESAIPFSATQSKLSVRVWSPDANTPILLKVEDASNGSISSEVQVSTTVANAWETLEFDFSTGSPALNLTNTYDKVSIFFDFGTMGSGKKYYCDDVMMVAPVLTKPDLPITFQDTVTVNHDIAPFGGNSSHLVVDPTNAANTVLQSIKTTGAQTWAGTSIGGTGLESPIPFSATQSKLSVRVWSPDVNTPILLKVEDASNGSISSEVQVSTTVANAWETLEFDFSTGSPALNLANTYDKVSIFFDFGTMGSGKKYYCDDVMMVPFVAAKPHLPITFQDTVTINHDIAPFGGNSSHLVVDPTNATNTVLQSIKTTGAQTWAGTSIGGTGLASPIPFSATQSKLSVRVWSPDVNTPILLKVEDASNGSISSEVQVSTTVANVWETLEFDFSTGSPALNLANTYDKVSIFFDFGTMGSGKKYYCDDVMMVAPVLTKPDLPITFQDTVTVNHDIAPFGGNSSHLVVDPTNAANTVLQSIKTTGAQTWAGTSIGGTGLESAIPFSATQSKLSVRVWSPDANTPILLKVEDASNGSISSEVQVSTTVANAWETLEFDFSTGSPALNLANTYDKVSIFFDFGTIGSGKKYYADDVMMDTSSVISTPDSVDITFLVNTASITVDPTGLYVGGGTGFGGPSDNLMSDTNGDGVWEITLRRPKGFSSDYVFLNGNSGWGAKENLTGLPCAVAPWNDRHLPAVYSDTTLLTCYATCATDTVCPAPPADSVDITFLVNTANITVDPTGIFLAGGGNFGNPGDNPMTDADGDGVYEITVRKPEGFSSFYIFTNGNAGWGNKENLAGLPCGDPANFNDRTLPGVWSDTTLLTCYETCATDTVCVTPLAKPSLPITFQDTVTINHAITPFGGNSSHLVVDPTNAANTVLQSIKTTGAQTWAGTTIGGSGLASAVPFSATEMKMSVRVYSPDVNTPILLKVEDAANAAINSEVQVNTTVANAWETLTFDFSTAVSPINLANTYDKVSIFFDFGTAGSGKKYYCDDVMMYVAPPVGATNDLILTALYDGPYSGGKPKGVEVYVVNNIADLSTYGIGTAQNGGGTDGQEYTFPAVSATAGTFLYVTNDSTGFTDFFGFNADFIDNQGSSGTSAAMNFNGDDAVELYGGGQVIDLFGDIDMDGTGTAWEYLDTWVYRNCSKGPDTTFIIGDWTVSPINNFDGAANNAAATLPMPIGTYSSICPPPTDSVDITFMVNTANITVDPTGMFIAGGAGFGIPGDNPMSDVDGDGVWEITVRKPEGFTSDYTFTNGNSGWSAKEDISGQSCAVAPFNDRNLPGVWSDTTLLTCFGSCVSDTICPAPPATVDLTFTVDMSQYGSAITTANIFGSFNGWNNTANPLTDQGNNLWSATITVPENDSLEYKFVANGAQENLVVGASCTKTTGAFTNRFLAYGNMNMAVDTVCWESCVACPVGTPDSVDITFLVNTASITVDPTGIFLAGGGNFGNPGDNPMADPDGDGIYEITVRKPEGFSSFYIFTNGNSGWGAKENLAGLPCGDPANFNDRTLPAVWSDTTLMTCYETCASDTVCPTAPLDSVDITFLVNTANITVDPTGIFLAGGGNFGNPGDNPMTDTDGDGVWEITVRKPEGFSSFYIFTNGNSGWNAKENLAGLPCGDPNNFNDRTLPGVWSDTTLMTCYETCATDTVCATPLAKPDLPITFQDTNTINHAIGPFGGNSSHMVVDPTDPNNTVLQSIKTTGAQTWAGTTMGSGGLANAVPFTATEQKMSVRVWSPDANTPILLKVEDAANGAISSEVQVNTTVAGAWETLVFDFANGTPALNLTNTYDKVSIFFDFGNTGTGKKYYNDDVMMANPVTPTPDSVDITFLVNTANIAVDPTGVFLAGGGNFGNPGDNPMADPDGDGIYEITVRKPEGFSSFYIFTNGSASWNNKEDLSGLPCADPNNFNDRTLPGVWSDTTLLTCYETCATDTVCPAPPAMVDITLNVDMSQYVGSFTTPYVSGNFNGWSGTANPMTDQGNGIWATTITFPSLDSIEYKFQVDDWNDEETFVGGEPCTKTTGAFTNRFLAFGASNMVVPAVCWESCAACVPTSVDVTFQVDMKLETTNAGGVYLGADFDGWTGTIAMDDTDNDDIWEVTVALPKNASYEFKYINGPNWATNENFDPNTEDSLCTITTGNVTNRIVAVGATDMTTIAYCYNHCVDCQSVGVEDLALTAAFEMMPNPANNYVRLEFNEEYMSVEKTITMYNSVGQEVFVDITNHVNTVEINTSEFSKGMYFITVQTEEGVQTKRLVIIH